jgi:hypothetical protein
MIGAGVIFGGYQVIRVAQWPREIGGYKTERIAAHPHIVWLVARCRWLPWRWAIFAEIETAQWRDADPRVDEKHGLIYCSDAQADALRQAVAEQKTQEGAGWLR